jgi:Domain of unknown function (DUF4347)
VPVAVAATEAQAPKELVFIDKNVTNYQALLKGINPNATVILLDPTKNGVTQIAQAVTQYDNIDAIHIISHGEIGSLNLGNTVLNQSTIQGMYADELANIGQHLTANADILIYGCNFGQGTLGQEVSNQLAVLTGTDIANSIDQTGATALGGDWVLERQTGTIEAKIAVDERAQADFNDLLAPPLTITANSNPIITAGPNATLSGGLLSPRTRGNVVGSTALYRNVGTVNGVSVDLRARVTGVATGDTNDRITFVGDFWLNKATAHVILAGYRIRQQNS